MFGRRRRERKQHKAIDANRFDQHRIIHRLEQIDAEVKRWTQQAEGPPHLVRHAQIQISRLLKERDKRRQELEAITVMESNVHLDRTITSEDVVGRQDKRTRKATGAKTPDALANRINEKVDQDQLIGQDHADAMASIDTGGGFQDALDPAMDEAAQMLDVERREREERRLAAARDSDGPSQTTTTNEPPAPTMPGTPRPTTDQKDRRRQQA